MVFQTKGASQILKFELTDDDDDDDMGVCAFTHKHKSTYQAGISKFATTCKLTHSNRTTVEQ